MTTSAPTVAISRRSRERINRFSDLTEYDGDVGEAFNSLGVSYDSFRKVLLRAERHDLVEKLAAWKAADSKRLSYALGIRWQNPGVAS